MPAARSLRVRVVRSLPLVPVVFTALQGIAHAAEVVITPNVSASPAEDFGGWTFKMAIASISLIVVIALVLITAYLRFAPRFYLGEGGGNAPPVRPQVRAGAPAAVALDAPPLPKPAPVAAPQEAAAAVAEAPPPAAESVATPAVEAAATPAAAPAAAPARAAPAPKQEGPLELDQETFDRVLAEELAKGTDRRVAEGRARGAAARAARRKAQG